MALQQPLLEYKELEFENKTGPIHSDQNFTYIDNKKCIKQTFAHLSTDQHRKAISFHKKFVSSSEISATKLLCIAFTSLQFPVFLVRCESIHVDLQNARTRLSYINLELPQKLKFSKFLWIFKNMVSTFSKDNPLHILQEQQCRFPWSYGSLLKTFRKCFVPWKKLSTLPLLSTFKKKLFSGKTELLNSKGSLQYCCSSSNFFHVFYI